MRCTEHPGVKIEMERTRMTMKSISVLYLFSIVILAGFGCRTKEAPSEKVRISPSAGRGEELGRTLLHLAPNGVVAERLIAKGADVHAKDSFGMTPLHTAVKEGRSDVVEVLIARGADVNAKSHRGQTAVFWAVAKNDKPMTERLIARGADVNAKDNYDMTPLHSAALIGTTDIVELLIDHGSDVNAKDDKDRSPLDLAKVGGYTKIVKLLEEQEVEK